MASHKPNTEQLSHIHQKNTSLAHSTGPENNDGNTSAINSQQDLINSAWKLFSYAYSVEAEMESFRGNFKKSPAP